MAQVDVVLVSWNDRENVAIALDSVFGLSEVREEPGLAEVVISDNGSADGTVEMLHQRYADRVRIIENRTNLGFGAGVNRAILQTTSPYIFLLNPDATVNDGCLTGLVAFMKRHPQCAIAGPKIFGADGRIAESCGEFDTWAGA
ncbi:MAG: glycosyltransferase, partial [Candidatus Baltobacteraceae bacterium]